MGHFMLPFLEMQPRDDDSDICSIVATLSYTVSPMRFLVIIDYRQHFSRTKAQRTQRFLFIFFVSFVPLCETKAILFEKRCTRYFPAKA